MRRICRQRGFTLAEIIVVVALLAILGTGALVGLKRSRDSTALRKTVQNLSAIDLAKQTWQRFHPNDTWPASELDRWSAIAQHLNLAGAAVEMPPGSGYCSWDGFTPEGYAYRIGSLAEPAGGQCNGIQITRPLD
jgi:prepilin-type N-terminal cleavage/methylation domain-containing protein